MTATETDTAIGVLIQTPIRELVAELAAQLSTDDEVVKTMIGGGVASVLAGLVYLVRRWKREAAKADLAKSAESKIAGSEQSPPAPTRGVE